MGMGYRSWKSYCWALNTFEELSRYSSRVPRMRSLRNEDMEAWFTATVEVIMTYDSNFGVDTGKVMDVFRDREIARLMVNDLIDPRVDLDVLVTGWNASWMRVYEDKSILSSSRFPDYQMSAEDVRLVFDEILHWESISWNPLSSRKTALKSVRKRVRESPRQFFVTVCLGKNVYTEDLSQFNGVMRVKARLKSAIEVKPQDIGLRRSFYDLRDQSLNAPPFQRLGKSHDVMIAPVNAIPLRRSVYEVGEGSGVVHHDDNPPVQSIGNSHDAMIAPVRATASWRTNYDVGHAGHSVGAYEKVSYAWGKRVASGTPWERDASHCTLDELYEQFDHLPLSDDLASAAAASARSTAAASATAASAAAASAAAASAAASAAAASAAAASAAASAPATSAMAASPAAAATSSSGSHLLPYKLFAAIAALFFIAFFLKPKETIIETTFGPGLELPKVIIKFIFQRDP